MEELLAKIYDSHGLSHAIVAILLIQISHLLIKACEFGWELFSNKRKADTKAIEELTNAVKRLETQLEKTSLSIKSLEDIPKHMNRAFAALKLITGPTKWSKIKKQILDDSL